MAGHGGAGGAAVAALDDVTEFFYCHLVTAHLDECADNGAHHVAQEAVGGDGEDPLVILLGPLGMGDAAVVGLDVGVMFGEGGEVGIVKQAGGGVVHEVEVEARRAAPTQGVTEGVLACDGEVLVGAAGGVETGVGVVMHRSDAVDGDVGRQQGVEAVYQTAHVLNRLLGVEVGDHEAGVNACVGAACSRDGCGDAQQCCQCLLDGLLHRGVMGLHLPAVERRAPIAQFHEITHCCLWLVSRKGAKPLNFYKYRKNSLRLSALAS